MKLSELIGTLTKLKGLAEWEDPVVVVEDWVAPQYLPTKLSTAGLKRIGDGDSIIVLQINVPPNEPNDRIWANGRAWTRQHSRPATEFDAYGDPGI